MDLLNIYGRQIDALSAEGRCRVLREENISGMRDFTGNDYLGISATGTLERNFLERLSGNPEPPGFTSSASRLLTLRNAEYTELEDTLTTAYGKRALLFNSGYHANTGAVSALSSLPGTLLVSDKLVHASIIDGIRLSKAPFLRFRHNDIESLRQILRREHDNYERIWVITESIFSMDGDQAPLAEIVALKEEFPKMLLYVDEAHGVGVRGATGLGLAEELGLIEEIDLIVGTFGKALASVGAFIVAEQRVREFLVNNARSLIFSTALPPVNIAYSLLTFRAVRMMDSARNHLAKISRRLAEAMEQITGEPNPSTSQIVPWIIGGNERVVKAASLLRDNGFMVMPIRRPTVAPGTERLRFSLSAALTDEDVDALIALLPRIKVQL